MKTPDNLDLENTIEVEGKRYSVSWQYGAERRPKYGILKEAK
jgi:hypothetical protein